MTTSKTILEQPPPLSFEGMLDSNVLRLYESVGISDIIKFFSSTPDIFLENTCVCITSVDHKILYCNSTFEKSYGHKMNDILGKDINTLLTANSTAYKNVLKIKTEAIGSQKTFETWVDTKVNGSSVNVRIIIKPIISHDKTKYLLMMKIRTRV